ncbi:NUDIX hydrolase [Defluviimonas sp. WL0024]|uniref:NUDIX hydrolase n=2 Tax=Albidovulum TaxID=205889 RepID=A0ABT3J206_9RHOB|nr:MULTISPECIES: NUDIX hydrolase [Defluviimonas]MCU9848121.1 NUDIX hydrolase [Defluviimonas sp. WL0024]MCW3781449.1 NUDIX hydrolase [Defluviimonas salinarum]
MIRRFGEPLVRGQRYGLRHGVYAVLLRGRDVLLTHQAEPDPEFQLPGGGIDPGESPLWALHREVREETGWSITAPRRIGAFRRFVYMPEYDKWAEKLCTIYLARPARRHGPPTEPGHSAIWMPAEAAVPILGNSGDRHFLARVLRTL